MTPARPADLDDASYWPSIHGVPFDPRDVATRELLFRAAIDGERAEEGDTRKRTAACGCRWNANVHGELCPEHGLPATDGSIL